jgi:hypothetical protein
MKASEVRPAMFNLGGLPIKKRFLIQRWEKIIKNTKHMEETMLTLMSNPETTPMQMVQVAKLYASVTKQLHEHAIKIDEYLITESKPKDSACGFCGSTEPFVVEYEGEYPHCPNCKGV